MPGTDRASSAKFGTECPFPSVSIIACLDINKQTMHRGLSYRHPYHEIRLWFEGEAKAWCGSESFNLRSGDVTITPKGEEHFLELLPKVDGPPHFMLIAFGLEDGVLESLASGGAIRRHYPGALLDQSARDCLNRMMGEYLSGPTWNKTEYKILDEFANDAGLQDEPYGIKVLRQALLIEFMIYLFRTGSRDTEQPSEKQTEIALNDLKSIWDRRLVLKVRNDMATNYHKAISIPDLAAQYGMGEDSFRRMFRRVMGHSPKHYLVKLRIEAAKNMLSNSTLPLKAVARKTGFQGAVQFTKTFKKLTRITPTDWRGGSR